MCPSDWILDDPNDCVDLILFRYLTENTHFSRA